MKHVCRAFGILVGLTYLSLLLAPGTASGTELKEETIQAWDAYIQKTNTEMDDRIRGPFLWVDEVPDRAQFVRDGGILVSSIGRQNPKPVASGLIHHRIGTAFIRNAKIADVLVVVRDYDRYSHFYKPSVVDSRSLGTEGACDKYSMLLANTEVVSSTALDAECQACYHQVSDTRWYSLTATTRLQEIQHYGRPDAHKLPAGHGNGYIWRLYSFVRFEERDGGVYIELEAIALSRDIPFAFRWVVTPIVRRVSKNSVLISLRQTEDAVRAKAGISNVDRSAQGDVL